MAGEKYHVTKTESGWQGRREDATRASVKAATKAEAVKRTMAIAKNKYGSKVYIYKADGTMQERRVPPRNADEDSSEE